MKLFFGGVAAVMAGLLALLSFLFVGAAASNAAALCGSAGEGGVTVTGQGDKGRAEFIWSTLLANGYTEAQAAGVLGNLHQETGGTFDPTMRQQDGPGIGIAQWTDGDRWAELTGWAQRKDKDEWELATQVEYLLLEMQRGVLGYRDNAYRRITDPAAAARYFNKEFEGSGDSAAQIEAGRVTYAQQWLKKLHGTAARGGAAGGSTAVFGAGGGSTTWASRINTAKQLAKSLKHDVAVSVVDVATGKELGGFGQQRSASIASMVKAFLLAAYLDSIGSAPVPPGDEALLKAMITRSDDDASVAIRNKIGWPNQVQRFLNDQLGIPGVTLNDRQGLSQVTARQMATGFANLEASIPVAHRSYAMGLLEDLIPAQQWGMPQAAQAAGWTWAVKGGWLDGEVHQTGLFSNGGGQVAISILQTGVKTTEKAIDTTPNTEPGPGTLAELTTILLGSNGAANGCATGGGDACVPLHEEGKAAFANRTGYTYDGMSPDARRLIDCVESWFPGRFAPSTYGAHLDGWAYAVDLMVLGPDGKEWTNDECTDNHTTSEQDYADGTEVTKRLHTYAKNIGVEYMIWQDKIRAPGQRSEDKQWVPINQWRQDGYNNGDCNNTHFNHIHVTVAGDEGTGMPTAASAGGWQLPLGGKYPVDTWSPPVFRPVHPVTGQPSCHEGSDIPAPTGVPVRAVSAGKIVEAKWSGGWGNQILIEHPNGVTTRYAHLSTYKARQGAEVAAGTVIGLVGATGRVTGAHLHFEVTVNGALVMPHDWITRQEAVPIPC